MTQLEHKFERNMLNMKEKAFMKKMKELSMSSRRPRRLRLKAVD